MNDQSLLMIGLSGLKEKQTLVYGILFGKYTCIALPKRYGNPSYMEFPHLPLRKSAVRRQ